MGIDNFKKIMIATDGSDCSKQAVDKGIEFARLSGGTVYAVYVVSTVEFSAVDGGDYLSSIGMNPYLGSIYEAMYDAMKKQGQQAVNYVKGLGEKKGVNVETVLLEGHPADELIKYAEEEKMDIVIMGTIGKTGLDRLLLGSVTGNLVRHSKVPVMVIREKCEL
jgi:nucleotide-binding universal stress UspA family protein